MLQSLKPVQCLFWPDDAIHLSDFGANTQRTIIFDHTKYRTCGFKQIMLRSEFIYCDIRC